MTLTGRNLLGVAAGSVALVVSLFCPAALADQIVVLDQTWQHAPDLSDSHYRVAPATGTPSDWVSPVDYSKGTAHVYLEVHTKPTDQPTKFQVCFEATPTYACTDQSPTYTTVGVYEWATSFSSFWSPPGESVDWTKGVNKIACILKDTMNNKPSADNVGDEKAALYMPTDVRMVVTIVAPGSTYVPPKQSGEGGSGSGGAGSTGSTSAGGTGRGSIETSSTGATSSATGGGSNGGTGGSSPTSGGGDSGCAMSSTSNDASPAWLVLAGAAVVLGRLRRRSPRG